MFRVLTASRHNTGKMSSYDFDLLVIGGGSGGLAVCASLARLVYLASMLLVLLSTCVKYDQKKIFLRF